MIIRFNIKNYRSFNEKIEFNMLAGNYKRHKDHVYEHENLNVLKNTAFYGPNAAGKTNFIIALEELALLVINGTKNRDELIPYYPFRLDKSQRNNPTEFEIDFLQDGIVFSYAIKFTDKNIYEEWLYILKSGSSELVFERSTNPEDQVSKLKLNEIYFKDLGEEIKAELINRYQKELRHNQPFILEAYNKDFKYITDATKWFIEKLWIVFPNRGIKGLVHGLKYDEKFRKKFERILNKSGLGYEKIDIIEKPFEEFFSKDQESFKKKLEPWLKKDKSYEWGLDKGVIYSAYLNAQDIPTVGELKIFHKDFEDKFIEFSFIDESAGTNRIIELIPALINISEKDYIIVIDEIENSLHPKLLECLLKFVFESNRNTKGQLIFTSHQTNILDLEFFRQDEIWFFDKNDAKSTFLSPLSDFKVRYDLDIENGYLKGAFGSLPCIQNFEKD